MSASDLTLHPAGQKGYIGRLSVTGDLLEAAAADNNEQKKNQTLEAPQTIFILDRSGSMGRNVARMAHIVIPALAQKYLRMKQHERLTLITFDSCVETINTSVRDLTGLMIGARGCTMMARVFDAILSSLDHKNPNVRIVAISDGLVHDTQETLKRAAAASSQLKSNYSISASAVRLFTSSSQPDTRALASILQLNTSNPGSIMDINASTSEESIIDAIGSSPGFATAAGPTFTLSTTQPCFRQAPWMEPASTIQLGSLKEDSRVSFWLDSPPEGPCTLNDIPLSVEYGDALTYETVGILLKDKINYFTDQLRILKVINSNGAKEELSRILSYFKNLENSLPPPQDLAPLLKDYSLKGRSKYMRTKALARSVKSISHTMETIANDERIANLNQAQQADYLRQAGTGTSRTTRGLARRAEASGMDFEAVMRAEIISMAQHEDDIEKVDDSKHAVSFYSQATTLDGIRCMIELAKDPDTLNNLTAPQMLRLFNVVGIPAVGPIGDFPDPMTYRFEKILYGAYVSVADITMALDQGGDLTAIGEDKITTAIPFFEDCRIQKFLQKYARSSLEYISSIGMRRMIAEIPKTYPYTICAGIWKMVEEIDKGKTEIRMQHFNQLVYTFENAIYGYFDHILLFLEDNQDPSLSYYLGHNGITNMIAPIIYLVRNKRTQYMDRILRALYSFESYQVMRRMTRGAGLSGRQAALDKILGVDFSSERSTPLPALFTRAEPKHCAEAAVDKDALTKYADALWFVHYATLLEPLFAALIHSNGDEDYMQKMKDVPSMSPSSITTALGLRSAITLDDFMLYNVVEGLLYGDKPSRIDKETNKPKLGDLGNQGVGAAMIGDYVRSRYAADYENRLKQQFGEEQRILQDELIASLIGTTDMEEFVSLLRNGNTRGAISVVIDRDNCPGFQRLHDAMMDLENEQVTVRVPKLCVIYSGLSPSGDTAFNGGNLYHADWKPLEQLMVSLGETDSWKRLENDRLERGHVYRGGSTLANRHGHSNDLPSYHAFGCTSLKDYHRIASREAWSDYVRKHSNCCGVSEYMYALNFN